MTERLFIRLIHLHFQPLLAADEDSAGLCALVGADDALFFHLVHDAGGAEKLLGMGDMLFMPVGAPKPTRIQGTFVRDEEISRVLDFIKKSATVQYDEAMIEAMEKHAIQDGKKGSSSADSDEEGGSDPMLKQAVEVDRKSVV